MTNKISTTIEFVIIPIIAGKDLLISSVSGKEKCILSTNKYR